MSSYISNMKDYFSKACRLGVVEFVLSDILQKGMVFIGGFVVVRILTKEEYGSYTYILNIFSIFTLLGDFGISAAILQFGSVHYANETKRKSYMKYGEKALRRVSLISICIIVIASFLFTFNIDGTRDLFQLLILLPVFNNEILYYQSILRVGLKNKKYAKMNIISTTIHYASLIGLAYIMGLKGAVIAAYPEAVLVLCLYVFTVNPKKTYYTEGQLNEEEKKEFWKFSVMMQMNQTSLALLNYLDIYCLGRIAKNPDVIAEYKVASTIPTALYFVPKSIMFFMVPIMGRKKKDIGWAKNVFKNLVLVNAILGTSIALVLGIFSRLIIKTIYGEQYIDSVNCFLILLAGYIVYGMLQAPSSNMLSIQEKMHILFFISIAGAVLNIVLNIKLINIIGSSGAAIATVASHMFIGCVMSLYLVYFFQNDKKQEPG